MIESNIELVNKVTTKKQIDGSKFENKLRPKGFDQYIGQTKLKNNLKISIAAAKKRNDVLDHILLHGSPGIGKTTLANIIATELGSNLRVTSGPALEKQGDVASIISNLKENDVLFIDEIHRLKPVVEEVLYTAMEDFAIDIIIGKGSSARSMRIDLPRFCLIGATTKVSMISSPLRDRFGNVCTFENYSDENICDIIERSARILDCDIDADAAIELSKSSRSTPRIANRLLKRVRDYSEVTSDGIISMKILKEALKALGIDKLGLDDRDREILKIMAIKFSGRPVGLSTLAAAANEEQATIEDVYEPFLIQLGLLERTQRGRKITSNGYRHLGMDMSL